VSDEIKAFLEDWTFLFLEDRAVVELFVVWVLYDGIPGIFVIALLHILTLFKLV
jgi:hypothetical protein